MDNSIEFFGDVLPKRSTKHSVGYDFFALEDVTIASGERVVVNTGVTCKFPETLWLGIYGRSSFVKKGLINPLGVGVVDADYYQTGNPIGVALWNITDKPITIHRGVAIGQGIFHKVFKADDEVDIERTGGFGSTDTIMFKGELLPTRRATYKYSNGEVLSGVVVPDTDLGNDDDLVFISDVERGYLHDGDDTNYRNRCWWIFEGDYGLQIIT